MSEPQLFFVTVQEGKDMKDAGTFVKMSPYAEVGVLGHTLKTIYVSRGGSQARTCAAAVVDGQPPLSPPQPCSPPIPHTTHS